MNKVAKITIIIILSLIVFGILGYKTISINKPSQNKIDSTQKNIPMLIDLGATTCMPCKQMVPVLEETKKMYEGKAIVKVIDVYENPKEANKYNIRVIPTQIFFDKEGKEFYRHEGFFEKEEIVKIFSKMGVN